MSSDFEIVRLCCTRGDERVQDEMFSCVTLEQRVRQDHPLREIRRLMDAVLVSLVDRYRIVKELNSKLYTKRIE